MDEYEQQYEEYPRDEKIDEVKPQIMSRIFDKFPRKVFYSVQVETALERDYFHWITGKGLAELANEARLVRTPQHVVGQFVNFYTHPGHRYFRREAKQLASLLARLYDPEFTQAIGSHCEMLFDSALARRHFVPVAWYTNEWNGKKWPDSNQNLDRIVIRDQIAYGIEIKNTQNYIDREELQDKTKLCSYLGLVPLFLMRFAPKSYIYEVNRQGGVVILFEEQIYPFGHRKLMEEVRNTLGLKVQCPRDIPDGHMGRLEKQHQKILDRRAR